MAQGSSPVAVTETSDFAPASNKDFLGIQATIECGFTLKRVSEMTRTFSHMLLVLKNQCTSESSVKICYGRSVIRIARFYLSLDLQKLRQFTLVLALIYRLG